LAAYFGSEKLAAEEAAAKKAAEEKAARELGLFPLYICSLFLDKKSYSQILSSIAKQFVGKMMCSKETFSKSKRLFPQRPGIGNNVLVVPTFIYVVSCHILQVI